MSEVKVDGEKWDDMTPEQRRSAVVLFVVLAIVMFPLALVVAVVLFVAFIVSFALCCLVGLLRNWFVQLALFLVMLALGLIYAQSLGYHI